MLLGNELANSNIISNVFYTDGQSTNLLVGTSTGTIDEELYSSFMSRIHEARGAYLVQQPTEQYPYLLSGSAILCAI